jgi:hypothetical protein
MMAKAVVLVSGFISFEFLHLKNYKRRKEHLKPLTHLKFLRNRVEQLVGDVRN